MSIPWSTLLSASSRPILRSEYARGVVYATAAGIALGVLGPVSNLAYAAGMSSPTFAALRATIGALVVLLVIFGTRRTLFPLRSLSAQERRLLGLTAVAQAALSLSLFAAYGAMAVALVLAVYFSYPLIVSMASIALGRERMTLVRGAALVTALAGLTAVVLGGGGGVGSLSLAGLLLAGVAATCQATYVVASRAGFTRVPSEQATAVILAGGAALMWLVALPSEMFSGKTAAWIGSPTAWVAIAVAGILGAALAKVWLLRGVRRVGGTRASVLMLSEPVTGVVLAAVLLGQGMSMVQVAGGVAVLAGAMLAQRPAGRQGPAAPAPPPHAETA